MNLRLLFLCAVIACLAGCDNNPTPAPFKKSRADGSPWITSVRAFPDDPRSLDPQFTYDEVSHRIVSSVYETLLQYKPFTEKFELEPSLGAGMPETVIQADGKVDLVCHIRPGLKFADDPCFPNGKGRELTSADFVYIFQRMADPKVECPIASTLQEYLVGMKEAWDTADKLGHFDYEAPFPAVQAVDRYTFKIHLLKPYPQLKYWLAFPFTAPVPREAVEYYDGKIHDGIQRDLFRFHPVGTGAFRLAQWDRGRLIRLVRNDNYAGVYPSGGWPAEHADRYLPHSGKRLPLIDELQLLIMRESIPAWILFKQGWTDASGVGKDVFKSVVGPGGTLTPEYQARGIELEKDVEVSTFYLMFNMQDPVIGANVDLRRALSLAYDAAAANQIFYNGIFVETKQLLPPGIFGYEQNIDNPFRPADLVKAKDYLAKAGYPNGIDPKTARPLELVLDTQADDSAGRQMAEFEKNQFEKLGIHVKIVENIFAQMIDKQTRGTYQFLFAGWNADFPDPENFFFLFYGPNLPPRGYNQSFYKNPEFDRLYELMMTMENTPERAAIIARMNKILIDDCVLAPIFNPAVYVLMQPWAKRTVLNALVAKGNGSKYAWIDQPMRTIERKNLNRKNYWPIAIAFLVAAAVVGLAIRRRLAANV
jgi:ABC-type transport system substrate-binding protein